jgi:hypothetical protein
LKIFDVTDKETISDHRLSVIQGNTFFEVIHLSPFEIMVIGPEGIFQYNVEEVTSPKLLSHIEVVSQ